MIHLTIGYTHYGSLQSIIPYNRLYQSGSLKNCLLHYFSLLFFDFFRSYSMAPPQSRRKCTNQIILRPPFAHGFRSEEKFQWFNDYFKNREVMIERALDVTCPPGEPVPFFIARLRVYPIGSRLSHSPKLLMSAGFEKFALV